MIPAVAEATAKRERGDVGWEIQIHLDVRERRLVSKVLGEGAIKSDGVVDAVAGPHHGTAGSLQGEACGEKLSRFGETRVRGYFTPETRPISFGRTGAT
jgi:hypothetical protein